MLPGEKATTYYHAIADDIRNDKTISKDRAAKIFTFFKDCPLFRWQDANNDCEDRANAICILLDDWEIPNYKAWIFSGYFIKKDLGSLINGWKYHVAALLPVKEDNAIAYYIIDPATSPEMITLQSWAGKVSAYPLTYHLIKDSKYYIFSSYKIKKDKLAQKR